MDSTYGKALCVQRARDYDKGSLDFHSQRMNYSRVVMNTGWDEARQQEPKDHDLSTMSKRDVFISTYDLLPPTLKGKKLPLSTYQAMCRQPFELKRDYTPQPYRVPMINETNMHRAALEGRRVTGRPRKGFGEILPRHSPDHGKGSYFTTNIDHYRPPFPTETVLRGEAEAPPPDWSVASRRNISQFTDCFNHRRAGRNHWLDESGLYFNKNCKQACPYYSKKEPPFRINYC